MADSDKNIVITPSVSQTAEPKVVFTGKNNSPVTLKVTDAGALSFEGSAGQLFSITNSLSGTLFAVNDVSGIPSIEVLDTGLIKLGQYSGSVVLGSSAAIQNASSVAAKLSLVTGAATTPGLIIKGAASQTADLTQWQNSAGSVLSKIDSAGQVTAVGLYTTNTHVAIGEANGGGAIRMTRQTSAPTAPGANYGRLYFRDGTTSGTLRLVTRAGTAGVETTLIDNIDTTGTDTSTLGVALIDGGTP
jgi:hypothetical protein